MPPLYAQRATLLDANAKLLREWFRVLRPENQLDVLKSMLAKFSLSELETINVHLHQQVENQVGLNATINSNA